MPTLKLLTKRSIIKSCIVKDQISNNIQLSKRTHSKESATRQKVDKKLIDLGWIIDEEDSNHNVTTERAVTEEQNKKLKGREPDYVLYKTGTNIPLAIIETKKKGEDLDKALKDATKKYAEPLGVKIIFAYDGSFFKTLHLDEEKELTINKKSLTNFISEFELLEFVRNGANIFDEITKRKEYTREELIKIFKESNDLLRKEGLREGAERFTEFSNILFLKYLSEMEVKKENERKKLTIDKNKRWDKIQSKSEEEIIDFVNDSVFTHISKKYADGKNIFENKLLITNGKTLKIIVDKLSKINLLDAESEVSGDAFEYFLKTAVTLGNDLGEYFTPRHIIDLIIDLVDPKIGEKIYDPTCGTGGFLIASFDKLKNKIDDDDEDSLEKLQKHTLFGRELTNTYKIAKMNMILRGDGHNNVVKGDCLENPIENKYKVALANIPYSQETDFGGNYAVETRNGDVAFVLHILKSLKEGGRACVIVPQGFLFRGSVIRKAREYLLNNANVKVIISLPSGVFKPYTGVSTAIIYFEKGKQTEKTWFYHMKNDGYTLDDKRSWIDGIGDINDIKEKIKTFSISKQSSLIDYEKIKENNFNLNVSRYIDTSEPKEYVDIEKNNEQLIKIKERKDKLELIVNDDFIKFQSIMLKSEINNDIHENWELVKIETCCEILDYKRKPINSEMRKKIIGNIPYYGANGVQGYINKHIFDEDLILLAEDGGNFEEYQNRPIAYFISGKSWVNNHAHVLKNKPNYDLKFIFYSLVHKNILSWINGTTRSKLNQSDLRKIKIPMPTLKKQQEIASYLSNMDNLISEMQNELGHTKKLKVGLIQKLLTE